jgi:hypothetical protein
MFLRKATNLNIYSESIRNPVQPLALPAQGRLVLGASRILEKKTQYIYGDATEV